MRKCYCKSLSCSALGFLLFCVGLIVIDNPDLSYGHSCPDVLMFLNQETEGHTVLSMEGINKNSDSLEFVGVISDSEDGLYKGKFEDEISTESNELIDDALETSFEGEKSKLAISSESGDTYSANIMEYPTEFSDEFSYLSEDSLESQDEAGENDIVTEKEIDVLISQVESASTDLHKALREASEEIGAEEFEVANDLNDELDSVVQNLPENESSLEETDVVLIAEEADTESDQEKNETTELVVNENNGSADGKSIIDADQSGIVALPEEIAASLEEGSEQNDRNEFADLCEDSSLSETVLEGNDNTETTETSFFDSAENRLSEDSFSEEELSSNVMEIEEINKEYGWETVEAKSDSTTTNSLLGFDSVSQPRKISYPGFNKPYSEKVDGVLSNEFWVVGCNGYDYYCWKFENNTWVNLSSDDFFSTDDPERTTIIWAHGYQTDMASATQSAFYLNSLIEKSSRNTNQSKAYRLVVWKWDSERNMARIRVDAKNKTALANCSGISLGKFIGRLNSSDNVCLIGFSFGAQVVGTALQYIATYPNSYLKKAADQEQTEGVARSGVSTLSDFGKISLMLISAACDTNVFSYGGTYHSGATIPVKVLNVFNPYDYALHYYPFVSNVRSDSLGVHAITNDVFPNAEGRVINIDVNETVGRKHSFIEEIGSVPTETLGEFFFRD